MMKGDEQIRMRRKALDQLERPIVAILLSDVVRRTQLRMSHEALEAMGNQRFKDEEAFRIFGLHLAYQISEHLDNGMYADSIIVKARYLPSTPQQALSKISFSTYFMRAGSDTAPELETFDVNFEFTPELLQDVFKPVRWITDRVILGTKAAMKEFFYWHCRDLNKEENMNSEHNYSYIYLPLELSRTLRDTRQGSSSQG